jgi:hypothetical protein
MMTAMGSEATRIKWPDHNGPWLVAIYVVLVTGEYALASAHNELAYTGITFFALAWPWYGLIARFFAPHSLLPAVAGFILNGGILFGVGKAIGNRWSVVGGCLAGIFAIIVASMYVLLSSTTKPGDTSQGWFPNLPLFVLSIPWGNLDTGLREPASLIPGFALNAIMLYLVGALIERLSRYILR